MWAGLGPPEALGEHKLLPFPAARGTTSLARSPSLHPHSQQGSISCLSLPLTLPPLLFFFKFIYFWLHWVFLAAHRLSLVAVSEPTLGRSARALMSVASLVLERRLLGHTSFCSCGAGA